MLRSLIAFLLLISLTVPSVQDWHHFLEGHKEIHCDSGIPNHVHQAEFDCEFHKFHFSFALKVETLEFELSATPISKGVPNTFYPSFSNSVSTLTSGRAPPLGISI
jgi:hypothetical protein